jgi:hypothetical protein
VSVPHWQGTDTTRWGSRTGCPIGLFTGAVHLASLSG